MDLYVSQLPGLSVATHLSRELATENNMLDGKSWRLVHNKHHKKQSKGYAPLKIDGDSSVAPEDVGDRRRQTSWRKTLQSSRPQTPVSTLTTATALEDTEDARSERSDTPAPHRECKPKLARYTSLFSSFKETTKAPEFSEPWSEEAPQPFESYVDPLHVIQSIRSHIINSSTPMPSEHHSGLLRLFEDYCKIREQKERLEKLLEETLQDWAQARGQWACSEDRYNAEIRRLELLIAHGTSGIEGVVQARQGSVVGRQRRYRKTSSHDNASREYEQLPVEKLDAEIKRLSQKVLLRRPVSPSGNMTVLSKQFSNSSELLVGTTPDPQKTTLSRQVQSELDLVTMHKTRAPPSITDSVASVFSGGPGDALPDETLVPSQSVIRPATECNAFIALRELGTLVAIQRGLQPDSFNRGLLMLFSQPRPVEPPVPCNDEKDVKQKTQRDTDNKRPSLEQTITRTRMVRKFQSQPQLDTQQKHHRQFSFELGADKLHALTEKSMPLDADVRVDEPEDSIAQQSMHAICHTPESQPRVLASPTQSLSADFGKPSKIPSPVQNLGRSRKDSSTPSLHSTCSGSQDSRRDSRSSVVTAFREHSSGSMRSPLQGLRTPASVSASTDYSGSTELGNRTQAKAAAGT